MTANSTLIALVGVAGILLAALLYLRRESGGRWRLVLMAFRVSALVLVLLLLLDLELPGFDPSRPTPGGESWVLVDPDLSLSVSTPSADGTLWDEAVALATERAEAGARLAIARPGQGGPEGIEAEALRARAPSHPPGDLVTAVRRLGEASADSVVVMSSFRRPSGFVENLASSAPVPVRLIPLGGLAPNAGIGELELPASVPTDEALEGTVSIFGEGGAVGDSVVVEIRADGELRQTILLPLPEPGGTATAPVRLAPSPDSGWVRHTANVRFDGDGFQVDDLRTVWVRVGEPEGGIFLVSLRPDWEPRVLLPVLEDVTGLEGVGYLRVAENRFLPLGGETPESGAVPSETFRERIATSELLVVQAAPDAALPAWLAEVVGAHPSVLRLLSQGVGSDVEGLELGPSRSGEWTPTLEGTGSPLSPFLSGVQLVGLPPLGGVRVLGNPESSIVALEGARGSAATDPVLVFRETPSGRRAIVLADGFWRWASREGEARRAYRGVWGGTAGWLMEASDGPAGAAGVRPAERVQPRGEPLRWTVPADVADLEIELTPVHDGGEGPVPNTVPGEAGSIFRGALEPGEDGVATTPAQEPGVYRWELVSVGPTSEYLDGSSGTVEVERWAPSLRLPPLDLPSEPVQPTQDAALDPEAGGRPLRTHPLPYVLILALLCAEWLGRRKLGLR